MTSPFASEPKAYGQEMEAARLLADILLAHQTHDQHRLVCAATTWVAIAVCGGGDHRPYAPGRYDPQVAHSIRRTLASRAFAYVDLFAPPE